MAHIDERLEVIKNFDSFDENLVVYLDDNVMLDFSDFAVVEDNEKEFMITAWKNGNKAQFYVDVTKDKIVLFIAIFNIQLKNNNFNREDYQKNGFLAF